MDIQIVVALIALLSSVSGGILVAIINHLLTRDKTNAEIEKIKAETQKFSAEAKKTRSEIAHLSSALGRANYYDSQEINEVILYDGTHGIQGYDIYSKWSKYTVQQGAILIQDVDAGIYLRKYLYCGKETAFIPKNELVSGERKFRISCESKAIRASYNVKIYIENSINDDEDLGEDLGQQEIEVNHSEWEKADLYYSIQPDKDCSVFIFVERLSGDGSLQIRNLVVAERAN